MAAAVRATQPIKSYAVTPSDTVKQNNTLGFSGGLWVGTGGVITGQLKGDAVSQAWTVSAGYVPGHWVLIAATGTTAGGIIGLDDAFGVD